MQRWIICLLLAISNLCLGQTKTLLEALQEGDSVVFYQCRVLTVSTTITTESGQSLAGSQHLNSVTEKFVIHKRSSGYEINYFSSDYVALPNRRFSGLKIREKEYWHFVYAGAAFVPFEKSGFLSAIEAEGREAIEYDYQISKHNQNQIIVKAGKRFKQLCFTDNRTLYTLAGITSR